MKRILSVFLVLTMMVVIAGCSTSSDNATNVANGGDVAKGENEANENEKDSLNVSMVTDVGGVNDLSFNQSAWEGMQRLEKDFDINVSYLESKQESDYETNIQFLVDEESELIYGIGYVMADAIKNASELYTDCRFAIVDNSYGDETPENVVGISFKEHEASFLVGYIAGKMTETNKVGFVGGVDFYIINKFQYGFMAGVAYANPEAEVYVQYAGSFGDAAAGKSIAEQFYSSGADVIYHASGATGNGVIEAAKELDKWVIGVDRDQSDLAPDNVLTSAIKRVDNAVYNLTSELDNGNWLGGTTVEYGLADGGVDIADTSNEHVPEEILDEVYKIKDEIISGSIVVPENKEEFEASYN
ncbi:MAG: BMP family ABC transporter substrate-binding protein [Vallitalea sp.]|nr:BMP family ABC transporter substrate-binding protein [Vallitalea sp.]